MDTIFDRNMTPQELYLVFVLKELLVIFTIEIQTLSQLSISQKQGRCKLFQVVYVTEVTLFSTQE